MRSFELAWQSKVDQLAEEPATSSGRSSKQQAEEASVCEVIQAGTCGVDQVLILRQLQTSYAISDQLRW